MFILLSLPSACPSQPIHISAFMSTALAREAFVHSVGSIQQWIRIGEARGAAQVPSSTRRSPDPLICARSHRLPNTQALGCFAFLLFSTFLLYLLAFFLFISTYIKPSCTRVFTGLGRALFPAFARVLLRLYIPNRLKIKLSKLKAFSASPHTLYPSPRVWTWAWADCLLIGSPPR